MSQIKSPELELSVSTGTILRQPVNGSIVRQVKDDNWPDKRMLNLTFSGITRTEKDALITIILAARPAGDITITDLYGEDYEGVVIGDVTIKQRMFNKQRCADDALYDVSFKYEGEIV